MSRVYTPAEALDLFWDAFCDCDWHLIPADVFGTGVDYEAGLEAAGLIEARDVTDEDLEDAFADERGIEPGGTVWHLTADGRDVLRQALASTNNPEA